MIYKRIKEEIKANLLPWVKRSKTDRICNEAEYTTMA